MSKIFDKNGNEIIKSPYIVDVDYINYTQRVKEMVQNGLVATYTRGSGNGEYDDRMADYESIVKTNHYTDIGDIAQNISGASENIAKAQAMQKQAVAKAKDDLKKEEPSKVKEEPEENG